MRLTLAGWILLGLAAAAAALLACSPPTRGNYASQPPKAYQGDRTITIHFMEPQAAALNCRNVAHEQGVTPEFCTLADGSQIWPNPCPWPNDSDYRQGGCHEIAHARPNPWPADHPGAVR